MTRTPEIRTLESVAELDELRAVIDATWPSTGTNLPSNLLKAIVHAGGYAAVASVDGEVVGAVLAVVGRHRDADGWHVHLHSHVNAVLPPYRDQGIGTALKLHQRQWAAEQGIGVITWTFDPLVRRNAWMNAVRLGVEIRDYQPDFYGEMNDGINVGDRTDRMFAWWPTSGPLGAQPVVPAAGDRVVELPDDIVALRRTDPAAALDWRLRVREQMLGALADGFHVAGVTDDAAYVLSATS